MQDNQHRNMIIPWWEVLNRGMTKLSWSGGAAEGNVSLCQKRHFWQFSNVAPTIWCSTLHCTWEGGGNFGRVGGVGGNTSTVGDHHQGPSMGAMGGCSEIWELYHRWLVHWKQVNAMSFNDKDSILEVRGRGRRLRNVKTPDVVPNICG